MKVRGFSIAIAVLGVSLFAAAMALRSHINPWVSNGGAAIIVFVLSSMVMHDTWWRMEKGGWRTWLWASLLGVSMVVATHLLFQIAVYIWPGLDVKVSHLYADLNASSPALPIAVLLTLLIVVAEEVLWRGLFVELLQGRVSTRGVAVAVTALYALPQVFGGSLVLTAAAAIVGAIFVSQRLITGSLTAPLITHAIWSVCIFNVTPVV